MANYYDEQLSRMSHLMFYNGGSESKKSNYTTVMNQKEGADGRVYGIVAEGTKYYIKSCPKGKETLTEAFDYVGGFLNRKECAYSSYADAVKDMDMRLMTLNENYGKRMAINEMKRSSDFMDAGMVEMQESIARHRQILENIDVIYQGGKGISDKNIGVPEAPKTQEYNTKVGDPFEDKAEYEENRDNKETAKDHEKQGDPFEDEAEYRENTDNIQKKDSNTPGDTYTKKAEYVPDNAVAAMHPSGGHVSRVDESVDEYNGSDAIEDAENGLGDEEDGFDYSRPFAGDDKDIFAEEGEVEEENHFPEENPDIDAAEFGELGDGSDELKPEDMENGVIMPDDDLETDEFLAQFDDEPEEEIGEPIAPESDEKAIETLGDEDDEIAGIDDMSGVDRNNLSAEVIDDVVNEIVNRFSKGKKMNMISESVARTILREFDQDYATMGADGNLEFHHPQNITVKEAVDYIGSYEPDEDGFTLFDFAGDSIEEEVRKVAREDGTVDFYDMQDLLDTFSSEYRDNVSGLDESRRRSKKRNIREMNEAGKGEREYYHDDDFMYGVPERQTADSDFKSPSPLSQYMDKGSRRPNVSKNGTLDPRKGAPSYVNPDQVDYDPESEYYLQNKYELGLNDDPDADYTESGAWKATDEKARKYATARVAKAQKELEMIGSETNIDTEKAVDTFRHALYTLQNAKNNLAIMIGVHPEMIEKFLSGNNIPFRNAMGNDDQGNLFGYKDAKDTPKCIITPDGELPLNTDMNGEDEEENVNYVVGPSLLAMGFPEMSTPELKELVEDLMTWDDNYGATLEEEENTMRGFIKYIQGLGYSEDAKYAKTLNNVVTEWVSLLEDIAGLQSFAALPMEVLNKREEAANMRKRRGNGISGGYEEYDGSVLRNLHEDTTVLHNFGDHPGYRKKPMTTPANVEVAPNGARDWNDESARGEEPFGKQIGSSAPFTDLVDTITKEVLKALNKGGQN